MKSRFSVCVAVAALAAFASACAGEAEPTDDGASAVQGGAFDELTSHNFAVGVTSRLGAMCSGTLIAPNLVLTARHCVVPPDGKDEVTCKDTFPAKAAPASTLFVSTAPTILGAKTHYAAREVITPTATGFCGNDIALIILQKNIPPNEARPAVPVVFSMTDRARIGGQVAAVGYGLTNPAADDSGLRRVRQNIDILCVPGDPSYDCTKGYAKKLETDKEFVTAGFVCSGDSGGGAFEQNSFASGAPMVLGVLSRGPETETDCLAAIYSRTDLHSRMIVTAGRKAALRGGYAAPPWVDIPIAEGAMQSCEGTTCTSSDATEPEPSPSPEPEASGCSIASVPSSSQRTSPLTSLFALGALFALRTRRRR